MADNLLTPNMNLLVPVVGQELAPTWAQDLNISLGTIDGHNHGPGSGVQITPSGLNINAALPFNSNQATGLAFVNFSTQNGSIPGPTTGSLYKSGVDLFYQDGGGNNIQITAGGLVNATSSGISSGTASASFVSSILVVTQSAGVGAAIDAASYILRYNGSYPSPSGNAIVIAAPSSLSGVYQFTLPATPPGSNLPLVMSTSGVLAAITITGAQIASSTITESNMVAGTLTNASINASAGIVGSKLATNVALVGSQVSAGGNTLVVSNDSGSQNNFSVIKASFDLNGNVIAGGGISLHSGGHASPGVYLLDFGSAFSTAAGIVAVANTQGTNQLATVKSSEISTTELIVRTFNNSAAPTDIAFNIIIIGNRS